MTHDLVCYACTFGNVLMKNDFEQLLLFKYLCPIVDDFSVILEGPKHKYANGTLQLQEDIDEKCTVVSRSVC